MLMRSAVVAACASVLLLSACGSVDPADKSREEGKSQESSSPEPSETSNETSAPAGKTVDCAYEADGRPAAREVDAPSEKASTQGTVTAVVKIGQGDITLTLDRAKAPCTVNSFVSLAEQGFYDDTPCPRLGNSPGFGILQCGDPSGTTGGGPGYAFADELAGDEVYPAGTLAMANAGPDTNGSQFFFVFADSGFPPAYTVFGEIDDAGLEILQDIAAKGDDGSSPAGGGAPKEKVQIEKVTVRGS